MELSVFDEVADALRGMVDDDLGPLRLRAHRYGIKVWFVSEKPAREHYEAQVIAADAVRGAQALALEVGFHAEHSQVSANDEVIARLRAGERRWRRALGDDAEVAPFLGRADTWRRISETWPDPDLDDPELPLAVAARLSEYIAALEALRRGSTGAR